MTGLQKVINGTTYPLSYAYNLAGEMTSITFPSGRVVQQSFDTIGRLCAVGNSGSTCTSGTTFATGFSFNAAFQVTGLNYGNGVAAAIGYTPDRLLLQSLAYTKGATTLFSTNYWYKTDSTNCPSGVSGNNGQIQCITDTVDSGRTISYSYDSLYRLTAATTNGSANYVKWGLSMSYDRYGNRLGESQTYGAPPTNSVSVSATTNQITGSPYSYDANGNMSNDGNNTLVYDAENRVLSAANGGASGTYTYDGNNLRVKKVSASTTTIYLFSGTKVIAEYSGTSAPYPLVREYIYAGASLLARIESGATKYYHQDHLSNRAVSDSNGNVLTQLGHYPFGESWYNATNDKLLFTSYERDTESGNDYAMMRSYVNRLARFSSRDLLSGAADNPQSLNQFSYVLGNPTNLLDPWGLCALGADTCVTVSANGPDIIDIPYPDGGAWNPTPPLLIYGPGTHNWLDIRSLQAAANGDVQCPPGSQPLNANVCAPIPDPNHPFTPKSVIKGYICGHSPSGGVLNWMESGATKGAFRGVQVGFGGGELVGGVGGIPGALAGGLIGGTVGAAAGVLWGGAAVAVCSASGVYKP
jgi:RHS repeat-associated protein